MGMTGKPLTDVQLRYATKSELASATMVACAEYKVWLHGKSRTPCYTWGEVERVAEEITRRKNAKEEP